MTKREIELEYMRLVLMYICYGEGVKPKMLNLIDEIELKQEELE